MDLKELIKTMVAAGFTEEEATNRVNAVRDKAKILLPNSGEDEIMAIVAAKINEVAKIAKDIDKFPALIVAFTERSDSNSYTKRVALDAYKADPRKAINEGLIAVIDGVVTPLETREFIDKERTKKNGNYGKPLGNRMQREFIIITKNDAGNDHLVRCFGDYEANVGDVGTIFGTLANNNISLKGPGFLTTSKVSADDLYEILNAIAAEDPMGVSIMEISDIPKNKLVITKGFVQTSKPTNNDSIMVVLRDEDFLLSDGIVGFFNSEAPLQTASNVEVGQEVITIGRVGENTNNGTVQKNLSIFGMFINPSTSGNADLMKQLDSVAF